MPAEAGADRIAGGGALGQLFNGFLYRRHQFAATDLTERTILVRGRTSRELPCRGGKGLWIVADFEGDGARFRFRRCPAGRVVAFRFDQDVGRLKEIRRAEVVAVGVIVAAALFLAGRRRLYQFFQQGSNDRFFLNFAAAAFICFGICGDGAAPCFLKQQLPDSEGACGLLPGGFTAFRGMMLGLLRNRLRFDLDPVDAHDAEARGSRLQPRIGRRAAAAATLAGARHHGLRALLRLLLVPDGCAASHLPVHCEDSLCARGMASPPKLGAAPAGPMVGVVVAPVFARERTIWYPGRKRYQMGALQMCTRRVKGVIRKSVRPSTM